MRCQILITVVMTISTQVSMMAALSILPESAINTIDRGGIAVIKDFMSPSEVSRLRADASTLYYDGQFTVDALAGYGKTASAKDKASFDATKDRAVLPAYIPSQKKAGPFLSTTLGDVDARQKLTTTITALRSDLAKGLDRPGIDVLDYGNDNHEISFTRFGPGALLARHIDEHHEECKGRVGWSRPTRRSLSWLVYLNEDWDANNEGGCLRTYERKAESAFSVGSRHGDLQIGWLKPTADDPRERPVFLDGRRGNVSGKCALYIDSDDRERKVYLTKEFNSDPYLFLTSDFFVQNLLIQNHDLGKRFHYLEQPKSALTSYLGQDSGEQVKDVAPTGGTLVVFDSVALPHEVMPTISRERWAASGWFHEKQQPEPTGGQIFL
mmetsp:Transcript_3263/g.4896  ORF Transcript_3263/g.4896 Transcript_3263/m.4896 type:complete len:382 (-) Transcript_3263:1313-2458(-)